MMKNEPITSGRSALKRLRGSVFHCIDAHTCGNPVRLVLTGGPALEGSSMSEKRLHFMKEYDWIRKGLMFEPRGHDMMSGSIIYPPHDPANDFGVLFIETSGCLPMCGHGLIGTVTICIQEEIISPKTKNFLRIETPAGIVEVRYEEEKGLVSSVTIRNVASFLLMKDEKINCKGLGELIVDVSYGGNFYAIVDVQENYGGLNSLRANELIKYARIIRKEINKKYEIAHPVDKTISGCSHVLWAGEVLDNASSARNAVVYGENAIDRSPCGTGTSARMAQWYAKGKLKKGDNFIHESIIGTKFTGRVEEEANVDGMKGIIPSISGWAKVYGHNTISIDLNDDPFAYGFQVL